MTYKLGVNVGIASVGFAGVDHDKKAIVFCGTHVFEAAETADGTSLAAGRREKRGLRRVIRRKKQRKRAILQLLAIHGFKDLDCIHARQEKTGKGNPPPSVWDWRKAGLERRLTDAEFAASLFHIAKRRGFQSTRKGAEPNDLEGKRALSGAKNLEVAMCEAGSPTVGAYLAALPKKRGSECSYDRFVIRDLLREEIRQLFAAQKNLGNDKATSELQEAYEKIAFFQRPLQSSEHLVGNCTLEPGEKRAPKFSYTAELFILWSKLNHAKIRRLGGLERFLTPEEKDDLFDLAHSNKSGVSYKQARKKLKLADDERFNISYRKTKGGDDTWEKIRDATEKAGILKLPGYHTLKDALNIDVATWRQWADMGKLDEIARVLSFYQDQGQISAMLEELGLDTKQIEQLSAIHFSGTINLSIRAIQRIMTYLRSGMTYSRACREAGYIRAETNNLEKVPPVADTCNPVVNRALAQTRKVINAAIGKYGAPEEIIIEMARDLGRNYRDRKRIEREQMKNREERGEAKKRLAAVLGVGQDVVSEEDILKYRLWQEQGGICMYSGRAIELKVLCDFRVVQIDHIVPYSRSWDNSYANKLLCLAAERQKKGTKTPYEYLQGTIHWERIKTAAEKLPPRKAELLLLESFDHDKADRWQARALNDTRYIASALKSHLEQSININVNTRNGILTAHLRRSWELGEKDRHNDRNSAQDAIVVACSTYDMMERFSNWNKYEAKAENPGEKPVPPLPWPTFREDAQDAVAGIFVSRKADRKVTGPAHKETIRSIRKMPDGTQQIVQRVKLQSLSLVKLEAMVDKQRNIKLYNLLRERLEEHDGKADKAFAEPVYMPCNAPGQRGPVINSIRVVTDEKSGLKINGGQASNGDLVRLDVFYRDGEGYRLIPLYVHHFAGNQLPNKVITSGRTEEEWDEIGDEYFLFSLYKNDLVKIKKRSDEELIAYYISADRSNGSMTLRAHDNDPAFGKEGAIRVGIKTLLAFEKYNVDYFGQMYPQSPGIREKRVGILRTESQK